LKAHEVVTRLARSNRVIVLGGIAVILHGMSRHTKDIDIWLDPLDNEQLWSGALQQVLEAGDLTAARVANDAGRFTPVPVNAIAEAVARDRFIRVLGADRPIDVFRVPNHLAVQDFDEVWERSKELPDGTRLIDEIDLVVTKMETGRPHDEADIRFLQEKIERAYEERLRACSPNEAAAVFERFPMPDIAAFAATEAADPKVRQLGFDLLDNLSAAGDPYAIQLREEVRKRLERNRRK
jgi:hypothetical protein